VTTRFYLPSSGTPDISPAFNTTSWPTVSEADRIDAVTTRISSTMTSKAGVGNAATTRQLLRQYISAGLAAQTISGTIKGQVRIASNVTNVGVCALAVRIAKCSSDGSGVTEILAATQSAVAEIEIPPASNGTTLTNRRLETSPNNTFSLALTSTTVSAGDRLIIELGYKDNTTNTGRYGLLSFGDDSATDLPEDETTTAANNPWVEFSGDISFETGGSQALEGAAAGSAQASAALAVAKALAGAAAASGTASADLALTKVLAGDATASALADAGISIGKPLAGDAVASGAASGALTLVIPLAGAATGSATASAEFAGEAALAGAALVSATASGLLSITVPLSGAAIAGASANGQLLIGVVLSGAALASALASGALTTTGSADLEGAAVGSGTASASLSLTVLLTGAAIGSAAASGQLESATVALAGAAAGGAQASAELNLLVPLTGAAIASALASGSLTTVVAMSAAALAGATASGQLAIGVTLQGDAVASATGTAMMGFRSASPRRVIVTGMPSRSIVSRGRSRVIRVDLPSRAVN
jgi:hypothetical protein